MSDTKLIPRPPRLGTTRQRGLAALEFAMVAMAFFTFVFGVIEVARVLYLYNTLQEVTRRAASAAANTDFSSSIAMAGVRQDAIFTLTSNTLALSQNVTNQTVRIDYLAVQQTGNGLEMSKVSAMPSSPADNRKVCLVNPYSPSCIRLVRVRICDSATTDECNPVQFRSVVIPLVPLAVSLPISTTLVRAESFGLIPPSPPGI